MSQTKKRRRLTEPEVKHIFETLGLLDEEERGKFISMKQRIEPKQSEETKFGIRVSDSSEHITAKEADDAKLEKPSR